MFIESKSITGQDPIFIRADRVAALRGYDQPGEKQTEVFLVGAGETLMVKEGATVLVDKIAKALDRR
ncbi:hypothetical protein [Thioalkalivibrio sp. ALE31]|uniref:hypothetical protein n=1 Tax=Thioalkalivibrio sp. ALE31 TaxID=1158182 RepID=UPI000367DC95|nr:hypothetical protein [Thioalkalivibrio sp. ALE31]